MLLRCLLAAALVSAAWATNTTVVYPFTDWDAVSSTPKARTHQSEDFGKCMCDLSSYCDIGCCCDGDCAKSTSDAFSRCIKDAAASTQLLQCVDATNAGTRLVRTTQEDQLRTAYLASAICVVRTNTPSTMTFYHTLPAAGFAPVEPYAWPISARAAPSSGAVFLPNDQLPVVSAIASTAGPWLLRQPSETSWRTPFAMANGVCSTDRSARFLKTERGSCVASASLRSLCTSSRGLLNIDRYRYHAILPRDALPTDDARVPIKVFIVDYTTNAIREMIVPDTLFGNLARSGDGSTTTGAPSSSYSSAYVQLASGAVCRNAVVSHELLFEYEALTGGESRLVNVTARLGVADVPENAAQRYVISSANVYYRRGSVALDSAARQLSVGSPGYNRGVRLLAGAVTTNAGKSAITALTRGLSVPFSKCGTGFAAVRFLHDVVSSSCSVTLTELDFSRSVCGRVGGTQTLLEQALTEPGAPFVMPTRIGKFANADPANVEDWVTVASAIAHPTAGNYDITTGSCANIVVGLKWNIFVARAGPTYNPQDVIVDARVDPIIGSWKFRNSTVDPRSRGTTASSTVTSRMSFSFSVTFTRVADGGPYGLKPILPPNIFPEIDADVFYPFRLPNSKTQDVPDS